MNDGCLKKIMFLVWVFYIQPPANATFEVTSPSAAQSGLDQDDSVDHA